MKYSPIMYIFLSSFVIYGLVSIAYAMPRSVTYEMTTGTGFYVDNNHIITNEHVVQNCKLIYTMGDKGVHKRIRQQPAQLIATDKNKDLALLKSPSRANRIATLRANNGIKKGDPVLVIGYPGEQSQIGHYSKAHGKIIRVIGPQGKEQFVEFTDSVRKGNSGGPLLDPNGNIIGVITGILSYYKTGTNPNQQAENNIERQTSIAVSLTQLKKFLTKNRIFYRINNTFGKYPEKKVESYGKHMIVNIQCIKNITTHD